MNNTRFKAGMYLLETLTSGMYNDPLSIYREYVQNAVDSIDQAGISSQNSEIAIRLDPFQKNITIYDNGGGISAENAERTLGSIGCSEKIGTMQRGFRGIGRLGGIAFAKKAIFRTKAKGEDIVSIQTWDCEELRVLLTGSDYASMSLDDVFSTITTFSQQIHADLIDQSFFEVKLIHVESFRNYILDIQKIKKYLMQVAPVPFDTENFSFSTQINNFLVNSIPHYGEYKVSVNDEIINKVYKDELLITSKKSNDKIDSVEFFTIKDADTVLAHGWYGKRRDLLGSIKKGEAVSGIRVKVGNIQVGDHHLLDRCFRENRFNSYVIGEIHVCHQSLIPNSRRDDFVDNKEKALFYNLIEREIGLSLSKDIRYSSRVHVKESDSSKSIKNVKDISKSSFFDPSVDLINIHELDPQITLTPSVKSNECIPSELLEKIFKRCSNCPDLQNLLHELSN